MLERGSTRMHCYCGGKLAKGFLSKAVLSKDKQKRVAFDNIPANICSMCHGEFIRPEIMTLILRLADVSNSTSIEFPAAVEMTPEEIRAVRDRMGIPQARLAELVGVAPNTLALWERGERHPNGPARVALRLLDILEGKPAITHTPSRPLEADDYCAGLTGDKNALAAAA